VAQAVTPQSGPGSDLTVPAGPGLPDGLIVPSAELVERFSKSPGPGGQSVNTTDSRVELEYDVSSSSALGDAQRARLLGRLPGPVITVVASEHRSQHRNRVAARDRLVEQLRDGLAPPPPPRRPTRPTRGSQRRRLEAKKQRGETKSLRGRVRGD
jgi:ribosome-associated protein